ncbi:hypothetical protein BDY21DRAFT_375505 [Lineolata rhizophorae]|uniref:Uncharacterized protein n=1 Tax=Lineolata rhizophorae TaxID=578093 RepID=A0A6A6NLG3_9PEZI|nr:hypothetical protein BDY21DRAFT_375505 [Lineolata rhizophorae]
MALGSVGKLDEEDELQTPDSVRRKIRRFCNAWERQHDLSIPLEVKRSMVPAKNHVKLHELLWFDDYHGYVHNRYRVDDANLVNSHCFTFARLKELYQAKHRDLVLLVGWKYGEPELKLKIKRRECKRKHKKQPEHIIPEKMSPKLGPPPLYSQPTLLWLATFISSKAIKGNPTLEEVLGLVPPPGRKHGVIPWEEDMLDKPVFPNTAKRAGFCDGMGFHALRPGVLVKVVDDGYCIE